MQTRTAEKSLALLTAASLASGIGSAALRSQHGPITKTALVSPHEQPDLSAPTVFAPYNFEPPSFPKVTVIDKETHASKAPSSSAVALRHWLGKLLPFEATYEGDKTGWKGRKFSIYGIKTALQNEPPYNSAIWLGVKDSTGKVLKCASVLSNDGNVFLPLFAGSISATTDEKIFNSPVMNNGHEFIHLDTDLPLGTPSINVKDPKSIRTFMATDAILSCIGVQELHSNSVSHTEQPENILNN